MGIGWVGERGTLRTHIIRACRSRFGAAGGPCGLWTVVTRQSWACACELGRRSPDGERELVNNQLELVSFATSNNLIVVSFEIGGY